MMVQVWPFKLLGSQSSIIINDYYDNIKFTKTPNHVS